MQTILCHVFVVALLCVSDSTLRADDPKKEGAWLHSTDAATGTLEMTRELTLYPQPEPKPALKHRLLPDEFDLLEGNAALYYLKAMGFFEQTAAREKLNELLKQANAIAKTQRLNLDKVPPYSYLEMSPSELPIKEVQQYLALTQFQSFFLEQARNLRSFSLDRNIRQTENPIGYLIPEVQSMRELARVQSVRCRLAIAEGRIDDAIKILGQQAALARHLGSDDFYVCALVGIAIQSIAWDDALYLVEHPKTPNLYWAYASLATPLVDMSRSHAFERQFLFEQIKVLREVDENPRPNGYWQAFLNRFADQAQGLEMEGVAINSYDDPVLRRTKVFALIAAAYPGAARYLAEVEGLSASSVESFPTAQVVFLAMKKHYERTRDEYFKWNYLPMAQAIREDRNPSRSMKNASDRIGWAGAASEMFLPALGAVRVAQGRLEQKIAMLQTVEAIRMYGAVNSNKLPPSLSELPFPAPMDPFTDQPLDYESNGNAAVLSGSKVLSIRCRLIIKFAPNEGSK